MRQPDLLVLLFAHSALSQMSAGVQGCTCIWSPSCPVQMNVKGPCAQGMGSAGQGQAFMFLLAPPSCVPESFKKHLKRTIEDEVPIRTNEQVQASNRMHQMMTNDYSEMKTEDCASPMSHYMDAPFRFCRAEPLQIEEINCKQQHMQK